MVASMDVVVVVVGTQSLRRLRYEHMLGTVVGTLRVAAGMMAVIVIIRGLGVVRIEIVMGSTVAVAVAATKPGYIEGGVTLKATK